MRIFALVFLVVISTILIVLIIVQSRGTGVGAIFGGASEVYRSKRGVERIFHYLTVVFAFLFAAVSFGLIFVR